MADISPRLTRAINSDCVHTLEAQILKPEASEIVEMISLLEAGSDATKQQKQRVIFILGRIGDKKAIDPVIAAVPDLDGSGKVAAVDALGRLGGAKARKVVLDMMNDPDAQVRKFAAMAIGQIGGKAALTELRKIAKEDDTPFVRDTAKRLIEQADAKPR